MSELYNFNSEIGGGVVSWSTSVSAATAYRTDLARGITAAQVPYSAVVAESTVTANLSTGTTFIAMTAVTVAE
jgi:hypothetical protein